MKKRIAVMLLFLLAQICCVTSSLYAESLSSVLGKVCIIRSAMNNNYVIDVYYRGTDNGTNVQLYQANDTPAQTFIISSAGGGYYKIINTHSNKAIDVSGGIAGNEVNVHVWEQNDTDAQKFKFESAGDGYYYIKSKLGYYLDVYGAKCEDWTNIQTYQKNGGNNQKWLLTTINGRNKNYNKSQEILNASWEVNLSGKIHFIRDINAVNISRYKSASGNLFDMPVPGQKHLARVDYIDSDTVFELIRNKSLNKTLLGEIQELVAGDAKNAGIEKVGTSILSKIGIKNVPAISTIVGVLEILATSNKQKDWNDFAKTAQNNKGIKKYTYINFDKTVIPRNPFEMIVTYYSYKTYRYEVWDGKTISEEGGYTGIWSKRFK